MAGKQSVFLCHGEKIYTLDPQGDAVRAGLSRGKPENNPHQRFPTLQPSPGQRKLCERKLENQLIVACTRSLRCYLTKGLF